MLASYDFDRELAAIPLAQIIDEGGITPVQQRLLCPLVTDAIRAAVLEERDEILGVLREELKNCTGGDDAVALKIVINNVEGRPKA